MIIDLLHELAALGLAIDYDKHEMMYYARLGLKAHKGDGFLQELFIAHNMSLTVALEDLYNKYLEYETRGVKNVRHTGNNKPDTKPKRGPEKAK